MYVKWIETWTQKHAGGAWQHWFWTLYDIRRLVARHYADYLMLYDSYESAVFRADAGRYFILHRYGGVYVDLDMDAVCAASVQRRLCLVMRDFFWSQCRCLDTGGIAGGWRLVPESRGRAGGYIVWLLTSCIGPRVRSVHHESKKTL